MKQLADLTPAQFASVTRQAFSTDHGQTVLAYLRSLCAQPPDYAQARDGMQVALHAAFLDGQRAMVRTIERLMEQAEPAKKAKTSAEETDTE